MSEQKQTKVYIPTPLRAYAANATTVQVTGGTVGEALADLVDRHPSLKQHLYDDQGRLRSFVNVFRNDEDIRYLEKDATPLGPGDELSIVPSVAGGLGV